MTVSPQVQGIVVGALASLMAMLMSWALEDADMTKAVVLAASSVVTASAASFVLGNYTSYFFTITHHCTIVGIVMVAVIALSRQYKVNPDNVATPIAAALGRY